jgi:hypothetical protein
MEISLASMEMGYLAQKEVEREMLGQQVTCHYLH